MDWDLQDFGWESSSDPLGLDPKQDHHHHDHHDDLGFTNSTLTSQRITDDGDEDERTVGSSSSGGGAPKRAIGAHKASCLVDGCEADLSGCREYHKRHRVCERHSKTPIVVVKGEEKRFCQQCSRFHSLGEFDAVKRSCRKRLDGHNRRRRKSHPQPLYFASNHFTSAYKGPRILQFGNPMWHLETKAGSESWLYSNPMTTSSSNEKTPLPIDSGGRALYLLSTTETPRHPNIINEDRSFQLLDYDPIISNKTLHNNDRVYGP